MTDMQQVKLHNHQMIYDPQAFSKIEPQMFTQDYWALHNSLLGTSQGRGITIFFEHKQKEFVLRHFLRGGLVGKLVKRHYFNTGYEQSRPWLEFKLLQHMIELDLPVPRPAAALISHHGLFYTADIILYKIPHAFDAHQLLKQRALTTQEWQKIGQIIGLFHNNQVFHHDLNIHNIMLDESGKVWLIDFDKCEIKSGDGWKAANLARLKRSLLKEQDRENQYCFSSEGWDHLVEAYQSSKL